MMRVGPGAMKAWWVDDYRCPEGGGLFYRAETRTQARMLGASEMMADSFLQMRAVRVPALDGWDGHDPSGRERLAIGWPAHCDGCDGLTRRDFGPGGDGPLWCAACAAFVEAKR